jgi:hypothetical protein
MKKYRNFIENKYNVCKQKAEKGWEEGKGWQFRAMSACVVGKRGSSVSIDFLKRHLHLRNRLLDQGYKKIRLIRSLKKFIFRYQDLTPSAPPTLFQLSVYKHCIYFQ